MGYESAVFRKEDNLVGARQLVLHFNLCMHTAHSNGIVSFYHVDRKCILCGDDVERNRNSQDKSLKLEFILLRSLGSIFVLTIPLLN